MVSVVPTASKFALPPLVQASTAVKWVKPAPLWQQVDSTMPIPYLAEFTTDRFMPEFLDMMAGKAALALNQPKDSTTITPILPKDRTVTTVPVETPVSAFTLYQPLHQRYYLVTGSLVCRHLGLPDHTVDRKHREKTSFVIRRKALVTLNNQTLPVEQGWVNEGPQKGWHTVTDSMGGLDPFSLLSNKLFTEERLPLHPVKVLPQVATPQGEAIIPSRFNSATPSFVSSEPRTIYHGYIPAGNREKYLFAPAEDIAALIQNRIDHPISGEPILDDPRFDDLYAAFVSPWLGMYVDVFQNLTPLTSPPTVDGQQRGSSFVILSLGDCLQKYLPTLFTALMNNTNLSTAVSPQRQALLQELRGITLDTNTVSSSSITLADAIKQAHNNENLDQQKGPPFSLVQYYNLYHAQLPDSSYIDIAYTTYLVAPGPPPVEGSFPKLLRNALDEEKAENNANNQPWLKLPDELRSLVKIEPEQGDIYYLRLVYERGACPAVLSDLSQPFTFAKFFDPVAPARPIRIELPSILPKDLRSYGKNRGVGLQMAPSLNSLINRVNKGMLTGGALSGAGAVDPVGITMICSFSISIIFLVAFIVMFIFLILFNIIFWWLAFIRICFPVPSRR